MMDNIKAFILPSSSFNEPKPLTITAQLLHKRFKTIKRVTQLLGSRLRKKNLLIPETFYWYRNRDQEFRQFFHHGNSSLAYCSEIKDLIEPSKWRNIIYRLIKQKSQSCTLHNDNFLSSAPVGYSIQMIGNYENMDSFWCSQIQSSLECVCFNLKVH